MVLSLEESQQSESENCCFQSVVCVCVCVCVCERERERERERTDK